MARSQHSTDKAWLPILAGAIGFALTIGLIGFVGWDALDRARPEAPQIEVRAGEIHAVPQGFVVAFEARNTSPLPVTGVVVEGSLTVAGEQPIVSSVTLDYIAGHSKREGGIFLPVDPDTGQLDLRALGYAKP